MMIWPYNIYTLAITENDYSDTIPVIDTITDSKLCNYSNDENLGRREFARSDKMSK